MERITIDISKDDLNFIREALSHKYTALINYLNDCEEDSAINKSVKDTIAEWAAEQKDGIIIAKRNVAAPYGVKKDGTPAKQRGRKPTKKVAK